MIDLNELKTELATMTPRQILYKVVKEEMQRQGHWKNKGRGRRFSKGYDPRRAGLKLIKKGNNHE